VVDLHRCSQQHNLSALSRGGSSRGSSSTDASRVATQVVRIFVHLVSADPEMVPALQQAHGLAALITLVRHEDSHSELAAAARQVLPPCPPLSAGNHVLMRHRLGLTPAHHRQASLPQSCLHDVTRQPARC